MTMRALPADPGAKPPYFSSGDLLADRRYHYAMGLVARGERDAAIDLLAQALALAPRFASAWFALGDLLAQTSDRAGATTAFRAAHAADPEDRAGAALRLAQLGASEPAAGMPPAYVRTLFDQYAADFETALVERLAYRGPALLRTAIEQTCAQDREPSRFAAALDLGCGTGLVGETFRPRVAHLTGVDISPVMIARAGAKTIYDRLEVGDLLPFLAREVDRGQSYDLVLAADVFPYFADLAPVACAVARALAAKGIFAFTTETHPGEGVVLGDKLRFSHGVPHVRAALSRASLACLDISESWARKEADVPAPGLVVLCARS
jgi:predicted TPR repeat methyltransferase